MNLVLTEEQRIFQGSVERALADLFPFARRQEAAAAPAGFFAGDWQRFAELGLLAAPFPEDCGGLGGGPVETMLIAEQFGRRLVNTPYLASTVLGGHAVLFAGSGEQRRRLLAPLAAGTLKLALAHGERQARFDLFDIATEARPEGGGYVLAGRKDVVLWGGAADMLVVAARTSGARRDADGIGLFLVAADAAGLACIPCDMQDGGRAATVVLDRVRVGADAVLGEPGGALPVLERVADHAIAFLCADAMGSMEEVHAVTLAYLKTRRQFGRALGSFQALQHRMVDLYMECAFARSLVHDLTLALGGDRARRRLAAMAAKVAVGRAVRKVAEEGVQLHGGIGMTMELPVGHHLKRAMAANAAFGDPRHHLAAYGRRIRAAGRAAPESATGA